MPPPPIGWFKGNGVDENESISQGFWSAMSTSVGTRNEVISAMVTSVADGSLYSIYVDESDFDASNAADLAFIPRVAARFVPGATDWIATALASTQPGQTANSDFGDTSVSVAISQIVGSPSGSLTITRR